MIPLLLVIADLTSLVIQHQTVLFVPLDTLSFLLLPMVQLFTTVLNVDHHVLVVILTSRINVSVVYLASMLVIILVKLALLAVSTVMVLLHVSPVLWAIYLSNPPSSQLHLLPTLAHQETTLSTNL